MFDESIMAPFLELCRAESCTVVRYDCVRIFKVSKVCLADALVEHGLMNTQVFRVSISYD